MDSLLRLFPSTTPVSHQFLVPVSLTQSRSSKPQFCRTRTFRSSSPKSRDSTDLKMGIEQESSGEERLIFTYGTLKKGFSNHNLMQDLIRAGDATFLGVSRTAEAYPLVCGPYRVPFLLNFPGSGLPVLGELYAVSSRGLDRLDELEGTTRGHYVRLPIKIHLVAADGRGEGVKCAEAYYAHASYAAELWKKNGEKGHATYSEKEARGYVRRKDRPQNLTFLDHIRVFISSPSSSG